MPTDVKVLIAQIMQSKKYRDIGVSEDTIRDILLTELDRQPNEKAAVQSARKKLHEVIALYLGDPDYERAYERLKAAYASGDEDEIKATCIDIMRDHDSTRERLPLLDTFYARIFAVTGRPQRVLDIACALDPLTLPWMELPSGAAFYGYDIHQQRVDFLNRYFGLLPTLQARAFVQDILVHYPQESGDVALLLKEIHRMEKRRRGIVLPLLDALNVRWIVLSSPTHSRTGRHTTIDVNRQQVHEILADRPWTITEIEFENELIYCINKAP
jgi:16S rRNA (guanine(1405)-N(7))-methyltransferase